MKRLGLLVAGLVLCVSSLHAETDYVASGYQYMAAGDLARAEKMFKAAIKINVENESAFEGLKKVHAAQANRARAAAPAARRRVAPPAPAADDTPNLSLSNTPPPAVDPNAPAVEEAPADAPAQPAVEEINRKLLNKYLMGKTAAEEEPAAKPTEGGAHGKPRARHAAAAAASSDGETPAPKVPEKLDDTIDKDLLRNAKRAGDNFNKLREFASNGWKREANGAVQFIATYYSPNLYKLLVTKLGAQKNWSATDTQKKFRKLMADNTGVLEFYVKLINTTRKPKAAVSVGDICDRTTLEDDNGNSYKPVRFKAPTNAKLLDEDSYTVWFPKYDADGNPIVDKAKETLFLVINDQDHEPATIRVNFTKKQFSGKAEGSKDDKSWWQKLF